MEARTAAREITAADPRLVMAEDAVLKARLRIVQVLTSLAVGGAERMALNLALAQKESGHVPILYCIDAEGKLAEEARKRDIEVTCFNKPPGKSVRTVFRIARALRRDRADVVHTHNPPAHYYGAPAAFLAGIPILNTRHSPISSRGNEYRERYYRWLLSLTDEVVFVSRHAQSQIEPQWKKQSVRTRVILNGIPSAQFRRPGSRCSGNRRFVFGAIGRTVPIKCYQMLIDAFRLVSNEDLNSELRIVGDGPLFEELQKQVKQLGMQDRVLIEPFRLDVSEVLRSLDVFVVSSSSEGLPMVVLEAMAAGIPIVSTRVGGIPEVVEEGRFGWFCSSGDTEGLAKSMLAARRCQDLRERGRLAAELALHKYDIARISEIYLESYSALVCNRNGVD